MQSNNVFLVCIAGISILLLLATCEYKTGPYPMQDDSLLEYPLPVGRIGAVGNSITAGFISGGWSVETLGSSYAALVAGQVYGRDRVGVADNALFLHADIAPPGIPAPARLNRLERTGERSDGSPVYRMDILPAGSFNLDNLSPLNVESERYFNNLAVPGYKAIDVMERVSFYNSQGDLNPLYAVSLRNKGTAIHQLAELEPETAIVWVGNNEVLGYALSGGTGSLYPIESNTDGTVPGFRPLMEELTGRLRAPGRTIFLFTVPDVSAIPAVSYVGEALPDGSRGTIVDLDGDGVYADTLSFYGRVEGQVRALTASEYVLLDWFVNERHSDMDSDGRVFGLHPERPLPDNRFLHAGQLDAIRTHTTALNDIINNQSGDGVYIVDSHAFFNEIVANGYQFPNNADVYTTDFLFGGLFSLDGVHPSETGHRAIANILISRINEVYETNIPLLGGDSVSLDKRPARGHITGMDGTAYTNAKRMILGMD